MLITEQQAQALRKILPDEADELLASNDAMSILDALDDLYITLLDSNDKPTAAGRTCERLRDQIHWSNFGSMSNVGVCLQGKDSANLMHTSLHLTKSQKIGSFPTHKP